MASLLDELGKQLDPNTVQGIGQRIGADEQHTSQAISALIPMLVGGLSQNVQNSPDAARSLNSALEKDHDGSLLEQLSGVLGGGSAGGGQSSHSLGNAADIIGGVAGSGAAGGDLVGLLGGLVGGGSRATDASGILGHVLGGRQDAVQQGVGQASGLSGGQVSQLMGLLAPLVMSALGESQASAKFRRRRRRRLSQPRTPHHRRRDPRHPGGRLAQPARQQPRRQGRPKRRRCQGRYGAWRSLPDESPRQGLISLSTPCELSRQ